MDLVFGTFGVPDSVKGNCRLTCGFLAANFIPLFDSQEKEMKNNLSFNWILPLHMLLFGPERGWKSRGFLGTKSSSGLGKVLILTPVFRQRRPLRSFYLGCYIF